MNSSGPTTTLMLHYYVYVNIKYTKPSELHILYDAPHMNSSGLIPSFYVNIKYTKTFELHQITSTKLHTNCHQ